MGESGEIWRVFTRRHTHCASTCTVSGVVDGGITVVLYVYRVYSTRCVQYYCCTKNDMA